MTTVDDIQVKLDEYSSMLQLDDEIEDLSKINQCKEEKCHTFAKIPRLFVPLENELNNRGEVLNERDQEPVV